MPKKRFKHSEESLARYARGDRYSSAALEEMRRNRHARWVVKSQSIHGERFNYEKSLLNFSKAKDKKVIVSCKTHELDIQVFPDKHVSLKSGGCELCQADHLREFSVAKARNKFLPWFEERYSGQLEIKSNAGLLTEPIIVECKLHRTTKSIEPSVMMSTLPLGCDVCAREKTTTALKLTKQEVEDKLIERLPDEVSLEGVIFNKFKGQTELIFNCEIHGTQAPVTMGHAKRSELVCLECGRQFNGYASYKLKNLVQSNKKGPLSNIGVMEIEVFGIEGLKVGVTKRSLEQRYAYYLKKIFFSAQLYEIDILVLENQIKRLFIDHRDERIKKAGMRNGERWSGDTEVFQFSQKNQIIEFIEDFIERLQDKQPDYEKELEQMVVPDSSIRDVSREKSTKNLPIAVVGIDPETETVIKRYDTISSAEEDGYRNISTVLSEANGRQLSGGLRWFREADFDPAKIPPMKPRNSMGKPIKCVETQEIFETTVEAEEAMRSRGFKVNASKISAVLNGGRKKAGSFHWVRVQ